MAETHQLRTPDQIPSQGFLQLNKSAEATAKTCPVATVPSLEHLKMADYDLVYEPSDDTFLMLDALSHEFDQEKGAEKDKIHYIRHTLEIGVGTGVSTVHLGTLLQKAHVSHSIKLHVTDINKDAIRITKGTAEANAIPPNMLQTHQCDLATPLLDDLLQKIDVLIFNPPYVPTPDDEVGSEGIEASWAGGKDGRMVLDRALPQIASLLSWPHGAAYVITVDDNRPEEIAATMMEEYGIKVVPLVRRRARNEYLTVLKFTLTRQF